MEIVTEKTENSKTINLSQLKLDGGTQPRAELNVFTVEDYKDAMLLGVKFPPITVFYDGQFYWLADGFHRVTAAVKAELESLPADIRQGTRRDAVLYSVGANSSHGLRRTNEDKRRAVTVLLEDSEWQKWSDREIARQCNVSNRFVTNLRNELSVNGSQIGRKVTRNGTTYTMQTALIGKYALTDKWRKVLEGFPTKYQETIWDTAVNEARNSERDITEGMLKRIASTFTDVATTGYTDTGNGKSTPISAALTMEDVEADKRNKQYKADAAKTLREQRRAELKAEYDQAIKESPLPEGPFRVIYADPPWSYNDSGLDEYGHAERHYNTMTLEDICALPIKDISYENSVLFLWATSPLLEDAFEVIKAWGFKYKTSFVWDKVGHNFGHYNSVRHEFLLIATRGSCTPDNLELFDSVQTIQKSNRHSEKPERFREIIDTLYTYGEKVELFARNAFDGWSVWGNEL